MGKMCLVKETESTFPSLCTMPSMPCFPWVLGSGQGFSRILVSGKGEKCGTRGKHRLLTGRQRKEGSTKLISSVLPG